MPWGALFLPLFTGFLGLWFLAQHVKRLTLKSYNVTKWLALGSALSAIGLLVYTGREVSVVQARPIWFSYAFPVAMFLSALQTFLVLLIATTNNKDVLPRKLAWGQMVTLIALAIVVLIWASGNTLSGSAIRQWLDVASSAQHYAIGWVALWLVSLVLCGLVVRYPLSLPLRILLAFSAMALCWLMRWTLLIRCRPYRNLTRSLIPTPCPAAPMAGWPLWVLSACG